MGQHTNKDPLGLHSRKFAEKVRLMNQTGGQQITLSAAEARNLLHDLFDLLSKIAELSDTKKSSTTSITISGDRF